MEQFDEADPRGPPGRKNRKARAFTSEILQLHAQGHTCEAIRLALSDAGVDVSLSTVQREVKRPRLPPRPDARSPAALAVPRAPPSLDPSVSPSVSASIPPSSSSEPPPPAKTFVNDPRSGRDIAAEFFQGRISNPLIRERKAP